MYKIFGDSGIDIAFVALLGLFILFWIISVIVTNVSIVDFVWGFGYLVNVLIFYFTHDYSWGNLVVLLVVGIHGFRLGLYITIRNWGHEEDKRYQNFRRRYGGDKHYWWVSFFQVFVLQWVINYGVCSTFGLFMLKTARDKVQDEYDVEIVEPSVALMVIGIVIAHIGTWIESIADIHLMIFKSNSENKGRLLTTGVWSLCRHPNYFGETLFWWGTYFFSCAVQQYWAIYSPVIMTLLIIYVSGVGLLEDGMTKNDKYGDEYLEYIKSTKKFIPFIW